MKKDTVTINGVAYDAHTGARITAATPTKPSSPKHAVASQSIHAKTQRTKTLTRRHTKTGKRTTLLHEPARPATKSPHITKFAQEHPKPHRAINDIAPQPHRAQQAHRAKKASTTASAPIPPARVIKSKAITDAVAKSSKKPRAKKKSFFARHSRVFSVGSVVLALIIIVGYVTYINLPVLSVRIAAAQAGINADYPSYQPAGYKIDGPVKFIKGEVTLSFKATAGPQNFTITQTKSNWDSSALLENYVTPKYGDEYATYTDSGLTIYVHDANAAWVNGGILHTITGNAPLTSDQIRRIAMSM